MIRNEMVSKISVNFGEKPLNTRKFLTVCLNLSLLFVDIKKKSRNS